MQNLESLEQGIELIEKQVDEKLIEKGDIDKRQNWISEAISAVSGDENLELLLQAKLSKVESESLEVTEQIERYKEVVLKISNEMLEVQDHSLHSREVLEQLESIGADVNEGYELLHARQQSFDKCREQLLELCRKLEMNNPVPNMILSVPFEKKNENVIKNEVDEAKEELIAYMRDHNYSSADWDQFIQDPKCRLLICKIDRNFEFPPLLCEKTFSGVVNGKDISGEIDDHFDRTTPYSISTGFMEKFDSELMLKIADAQGYNKAPRIVNEKEFEQYAKASGYIGFRTLGKAEEDGNPAKYVDEFEHMDNIVYNPTNARAYGDGIYFVLNNKAEKGVLPDEDEVKCVKGSSAIYGGDDFKAQVKITFDPSIRIITEQDLEKEYRNAPNCSIFSDNINAYAAAKGYDVVLFPDVGFNYDYAVVLNRTKLIVQDGYELWGNQV